MMKNGLECLRTGGFTARQGRGAAAAGGPLVYGDREEAGQGPIVLWQLERFCQLPYTTTTITVCLIMCVYCVCSR